MSQSIDLAGLAHRKKFSDFELLSDMKLLSKWQISPPYHPAFHTKQVSHPPTDRSEPGLSADT